MSRRQRPTAARKAEPARKSAAPLATGHTALAAGDTNGAAAAAAEALRRNPQDGAALHLLGLVARRLGREKDALDYLEAARVKAPAQRAVHSDLGHLYLSCGRLEDAETCFKQAVVLEPDSADAQFDVGAVFAARERFRDSVIHYRRAIELRPDFAEAHNNLGNALMRLSALDAAIAAYEKAVDLDPNFALAHHNLANALRPAGRLSKAMAHFRAAQRLAPDNPATYSAMGTLHEELGQFDEAARCYDQALGVDPLHGPALHNLVRIKMFGDSPERRLNLRRIANDRTRTARDRATSWFALGELAESERDYDRAFECYVEGNRAYGTNFDRRNHAAHIDSLKATYTKELFSSVGGGVHPSDMPIFIVGMPRSGTTLTEQILTSHPAVSGGGERYAIPDTAFAITPRPTANAPYPQDPEGAGAARLHALAEVYLADFGPLPDGTRRITDKMPGNFLNLGLIALMFPHARIVHCRRDPLDTCLSLFSRAFDRGHEYAYDLATLGWYYRQYERLMEHWHEALPVTIFDLSYEELVADTPGQARALVRYCGLDWNAACLDFHRNGRSVRTASVWQVRQPVYSSSVARWRRYDRHLGPLRDALAGD